MRTSYFNPNPLLKKYIYKYWAWENDGKSGLPKALPGVVTEMIFHFNKPFDIYDIENQKHISTGKAVITGVRDSSFELSSNEKTGFIAVRFKEGAFINFCGVKQKELRNRFISPVDIWGKEGYELEKQINNLDSNKKRVEVIEKYLLYFLNKYSASEKVMEYAVVKLRKNYSLKDLAVEVPFSYRHFNRKFVEYTGVTPKRFQKISNFDSLMRKLTLLKKTNYLEDALRAGYFDQPHFIKDFKKFIHDTPSSFLIKKNFMSHFYNTKKIL